MEDEMQSCPNAFGLTEGYAEAMRASWQNWSQEGKLNTIFQALFNRQNDISIGASLALGYMKEERAIPYLLRALLTSDPKRAEAVMWALGEIGDEMAIPYLLRAFEAGFAARSAMLALAKIASPQAIEAIFKGLADDDEVIRMLSAKACLNIKIAGNKDIMERIKSVLSLRLMKEPSRQVKLLLSVVRHRMAQR